MIFDGPKLPRASLVLVLAHGAGAPMDSEFMESFAAQLGQADIAVARFEFVYMAARRTGGGKRPPPQMSVLCGEFLNAVEVMRTRAPKANLFVGGKSMGGRVASLIADQSAGAGHAKGCVCLGYPFHPPKKPEKLRTAHLADLKCPTLIVQGERDLLGNRTLVQDLRLSGAIELAWLMDGDHDFVPRVRSGATQETNMTNAVARVAKYIRHHAG